MVDDRYSIARIDKENGSFFRFRDLFDFLIDIKDGKINNSNIKKAYSDRISEIEDKLAYSKNKEYNTILYRRYIDILKYVISKYDTTDTKENNKDGNKKSSGKGLTIISLPILLSELNINSSKKLINDIEQLVKNLFNNKQITKQVYNALIKAITYKNDS